MSGPFGSSVASVSDYSLGGDPPKPANRSTEIPATTARVAVDLPTPSPAQAQAQSQTQADRPPRLPTNGAVIAILTCASQRQPPTSIEYPNSHLPPCRKLLRPTNRDSNRSGGKRSESRTFPLEVIPSPWFSTIDPSTTLGSPPLYSDGRTRPLRRPLRRCR